LTISFIPQGAGQWIEEGPRGVTGSQVEGVDMQNNGFRNPVAGAVQQLALFDVAGGKKGAYAATVSRGIWKTDRQRAVLERLEQRVEIISIAFVTSTTSLVAPLGNPNDPEILVQVWLLSLIATFSTNPNDVAAINVLVWFVVLPIERG
jgi:hypothetical protein